jgi:hypothetical protein
MSGSRHKGFNSACCRAIETQVRINRAYIFTIRILTFSGSIFHPLAFEPPGRYGRFSQM